MYESDPVSDFYRNPFYFRPTSVEEYALWTKVWVDTGHQVEICHQLFNQFDRMVTPVRNVTAIPAHGARSVDVYIPQGIEVTGSLGHGDRFGFDQNDQPKTDAYSVYVYDDPEFDMTRRTLTSLVIAKYEDEIYRLKNEQNALP